MAISAATVVGFVLIAASGAGLVLQNGTNARLGNAAGNSFAAMMSFATAFVVMFVYFMIDVYAVGTDAPTRAGLRGAPWWAWLGGPLGAFYVCSAVIFAQKLGAGTLTAVSVTAQLICAILLDAFGLVGFQKRKVQWQRLLGAGLLVAGVLLITRFRGDAVHDDSLPVKVGGAPGGMVEGQGAALPLSPQISKAVEG